MFQSPFARLSLCAAGGALVAMTAAGPAAAFAAPAVPDGGGKVHKGFTTHFTKIHKAPSHRSPVTGYIQKHREVHLKCKVQKRGDTWYKLAKRHGWVNSDTVRVRSHVPHCRYAVDMSDAAAPQDASGTSAEEATLYPAPAQQNPGEPLG